MNSAQDIHWIDKLYDWGWGLASAIVVTVVGWIAKWKWKTDADIANLRLHVVENYVKKADLATLKADIADEFKEVKAGQEQILNILLGQKIGTKSRR